ncbi:PD-(D/E)XK nuclease domain-containing protein [bacterium]|nr:PD-(D/E)XK nuclease domain-containing protein [bacterium]
MEQEYGLELKVEELRSAMRELAYQGKIESLVIIIEEFLKKVLSNRDFRGFKESHYSWEGAWGRVGERSNTNNMERLNRPEKPPPKPSPNILKVHILTLLHLSKMYYIQSELEAERGYIDIFLREAPQFPVDYEWVLELKYVQKSEGIEQVKDEGMEQLKKYMQKVSPQARRHLKGALLIFGSEGVCLDYTTD